MARLVSGTWESVERRLTKDCPECSVEIKNLLILIRVSDGLKGKGVGSLGYEKCAAHLVFGGLAIWRMWSLTLSQCQANVRFHWQKARVAGFKIKCDHGDEVES